jgi:acyl carrier protein
MVGGSQLSEWPPEFEDLLRPHLPKVAPETPLPPDEALVTLGLDSLELVGLLVDIETTFDFSMDEHLITAETFYSVRTLWEALARCGVVTNR